MVDVVQAERAEELAGDAALSAAMVMPTLVSRLHRLGAQLDIHEVSDRSWRRTLRTLFLIDALAGYRLIAVAGGQGAGKTTLVGNLYPDLGAWLEPNLGRGERNPVAVVEFEGLAAPRGIVVRHAPGSPMPVPTVYGANQSDEWTSVLRGDDPDVLMIRLEVPATFLGSDRTGFVLLPGVEREFDSHWQSLMRIVLMTSPATVVVTDAMRLADATRREIVEKVRTADRQGVDEIDVVVALNRCDNETDLAGLIDRTALTYRVPRAAVVPMGADGSSPPGWVRRFATAVAGIIPAAAHARRHEVTLLYEVVRTELTEVLRVAKTARDRSKLDSESATRLAQTMAPFDEQRDSLVAALQEQARTEFDSYQATTAVELRARLQETGGMREIGRRLGDLLKFDPDAKGDRAAAVVAEVWNGEAARDRLRHCLETAVEQERGTQLQAGVRSSGDALRSLADLESAAYNDAALSQAIRALPLMALATRGFALRFADPGGHVHAPEGVVSSAVERLPGGQRILLPGLLLLAGEFAEEELDADPAIVDGLGEVALEVGEAGSGVGRSLGRVLARQGSNAAVGAALGGGPAAALAPALAATAVVGLAYAVVSANKVLAARSSDAHKLLDRHRTATVDELLRSVEELLRLTREVLESRLRVALGVDDETNSQVKLDRAIADVRQSRTQMLEILNDVHLA